MTDPQTPDAPVADASGATWPASLERPNPYVTMTPLPNTGVVTTQSPNPYVTTVTTLPPPTVVLVPKPVELTPVEPEPVLEPEPVPEPEPVLAHSTAVESVPVVPMPAEPRPAEPQPAEPAPVPAVPPVPVPVTAVPPVPTAPQMRPAAPGPNPPAPPSPASRGRRATIEAARQKNLHAQKLATRNQPGETSLFLAGVAAFFGIVFGTSGLGALVVPAAIAAIVLAIVAFTRRGKRMGHAAIGLVLGAVIIVSAGVAAIGEASSPNAGVLEEGTWGNDDGTWGDEDPTPQVPLDTARDGSGVGSYGSPHPQGEEFELLSWTDDRWRLSVGVPVLDADDLVRESSPSNDLAPDGFQYVVVPITYTFEGGGGDTGDPWLDVWVSISTVDGELHANSYVFVLPDHVRRVEAMQIGQSGTFNVAFLVPSDAVEGSVLRFDTSEGAAYAALA